VIVHHDPAQHPSMTFGQDPKVVCLSQAAWTLWVHGFPDQALKRNDEAVTLAKKLVHPYSLAAALNFGAMVHQLCRDARATHEYAEAAVRLSTEKEFAYWRSWGLVMRGWAMTQLGAIRDGTEQVREGLLAFRATGAEVMVPYFLGLVSEAHGKAGQAEQGLVALTEAQAVVDRTRERWWEAEIYRLKAGLVLTLPESQSPTSVREEQAENLLNQALILHLVKALSRWSCDQQLAFADCARNEARVPKPGGN
jgi:predicted ATPase